MPKTRVAQLLLVLAALALWIGSRLPWVEVSSFDGLGQPKDTTLSHWSVSSLHPSLVQLLPSLQSRALP